MAYVKGGNQLFTVGIIIAVTDFYNDNHTNGAYACYYRYNYRNIGFQRGSKRYMFYEHLYPEGNLYWYYSTGTTFEVQNYDGTVLRKLTAADAQNIDTDWNCYLFTVNDKRFFTARTNPRERKFVNFQIFFHTNRSTFKLDFNIQLLLSRTRLA